MGRPFKPAPSGQGSTGPRLAGTPIGVPLLFPGFPSQRTRCEDLRSRCAHTPRPGFVDLALDSGQREMVWQIRAVVCFTQARTSWPGSDTGSSNGESIRRGWVPWPHRSRAIHALVMLDPSIVLGHCGTISFGNMRLDPKIPKPPNRHSSRTRQWSASHTASGNHRSHGIKMGPSNSQSTRFFNQSGIPLFYEEHV